MHFVTTTFFGPSVLTTLKTKGKCRTEEEYFDMFSHRYIGAMLSLAMEPNNS